MTRIGQRLGSLVKTIAILGLEKIGMIEPGDDLG
jgi:hypothetical protein